MNAFGTLTTRGVPLDIANCDTDQIVPGRFLSRKRADGFGGQLFHDLRFDAGRERLEFPLNRPEWRNAALLLAGPNFGCGSSRESAVWALMDHGIRVVVAPSFGDIFFSNAFKNGLLAIVLPAATVAAFADAARQQPEITFEVDLAAQTVRHGTQAPCGFEVDPLRKHMLLAGLDEIDFTRSYAAELDAFEQRYDAAHAWLAQTPGAMARTEVA